MIINVSPVLLILVPAIIVDAYDQNCNYDCPDDCFDHCLNKYGGPLLKGNTYMCQKGCAGIDGGEVKDAKKYCCLRDFEICKENCQQASSYPDNIRRCEYGCTFWKENPDIPAKCGKEDSISNENGLKTKGQGGNENLTTCVPCTAHSDCPRSSTYCDSYTNHCERCQYCDICANGIDGTCGGCGEGYPTQELGSCDGNGYWSGWGRYSFCTKTCGTGVQTRRRNCLSYETGETKCNGPSLELRNCNTKACSADYIEWTAYNVLMLILSLVLCGSLIQGCWVMRKKSNRTKEKLIQQIENTFVIVCLVLACYMARKETLRYLRNDDMSTIRFKNFARTPHDTYPTFSICFHDRHDVPSDATHKNGINMYERFKDEISRKFPMGNVDPVEKFVLILKGQNVHYEVPHDDAFDIRNISKSDFNNVTSGFQELYHMIKFKTDSPNDDLTLNAIEDYNQSLPFYVSYQDPITMCHTREDDNIQNIIRIEDDLWLLKPQIKQFFPAMKFKIFVHHPGQLLRVFNGPIFVSDTEDFDWEKPALSFKISQTNILRKRPDSNAPCDPDLQEDDLQVRIKVSEEVGCTPVYWNRIMPSMLEFKTCETKNDMERIWNMLQNFTQIYSTYNPPCNEMKLTVTYDQQKLDGDRLWTIGEEGLLNIEFTYLDQSYQEIINEREFGIESLWSTVGGFVGIFVGTSLSQAPSLVANSFTWIRNKIK